MAFKSAKQRRAFFYQIGIKNKVIHAPKGFDIHSAEVSPDKTQVNVEMRTLIKKEIGKKEKV